MPGVSSAGLWTPHPTPLKNLIQSRIHGYKVTSYNTYVVHGTRYTVHGTRYTVHGTQVVTYSKGNTIPCVSVPYLQSGTPDSHESLNTRASTLFLVGTVTPSAFNDSCE